MLPNAHHLTLAGILYELLLIWPEHKNFIERGVKSRSEDELEVTEQVAGQIIHILKASGRSISDLCQSYKFTCQELLLKSEIYFRRHGKYERSTLIEANRDIYSNQKVMSKYVEGLLLTQILWDNHFKALGFYKSSLKLCTKKSSSFLEVGPGHGLLMHQALDSGLFETVEGWDISQTSLNTSETALKALGHDNNFSLKKVDISSHLEKGMLFDFIVLSEVLEHLEDPHSALINIQNIARNNAKIYINFPINSPAPDHLFFASGKEQVIELLRGTNFNLEACKVIPMTGYTVSECERMNLSMSVCVVAVKN